jgi:cytochrome P450
MGEAEAVSAWIMARCQREALSGDGIGAAIYAQADAGEIEPWEATLLVRSLLSAGVDTTIDSIGLCLRCLADNPDQWALLRDNPAMAKAAFEEATRYDSSSQSLFRTTLDQTEFAGAMLGKHEKVLVLIGSAGRDPAKWDAPDRFDVSRRVAGQVGYGTGIHGCVAQMMARLEGEIFFRALAEWVQDLVHARIAGAEQVAAAHDTEGVTEWDRSSWRAAPPALAGRPCVAFGRGATMSCWSMTGRRRKSCWPKVPPAPSACCGAT